MPQLTCPFCQSSLVLPLSALVDPSSEYAVPQLLHPSLTARLLRSQQRRHKTGTLQAPRLAPPAPRPALLCLTLGPVLFSFGVYLVALGTNLAPLCLALGTFISLSGLSMFRFNRSELPLLHTRWAQSSRCQSCFGVFPAEPRPAAPPFALQAVPHSASQPASRAASPAVGNPVSAFR